jgi:hypothetical protein
MTELKTLKDLDYITSCTDWKGEDERIFIGEEELKAEAIKWVKFYLNGNFSQEFKDGAGSFIGGFFNLTEEDLK